MCPPRRRAALRVALVLFPALGAGGFALPLLPAAASLAAQTPAQAAPAGPGQIRGQVTGPDGAPLASVAVTLRAAADSNLVTAVLTGPEGRFHLQDLSPGQYLVHVGLLGYLSRSTETIDLQGSPAVLDLGVIALQPAVLDVEGVEAVVERSAVVVEADRTVYSARAMPVADAGSATDVLRAVPELEVDIEDRVRLRGNQSAAIHLNGRPTPLQGEQLAQFLRQLPGDRIDRVEVMPNPSARHDPEGVGGIVNIVLREDAELGLSGSVSVNTSTRNQQGINGRLNVQKGRLTLFTGAGMNLFRGNSSTYDWRRNLVTTPVSIIEQDGKAENRSTGWRMDWTAEFRLWEGGTLWSNAWINRSRNEMEGSTGYGITGEGVGLVERYDRNDDQSMGWNHTVLGGGFKQVFEAGKEELTVDGRFQSGDNTTDGLNTRIFQILAGESVDLPPEETVNDIAAGNGNRSLQVDYFRPVGGLRLDLGAQLARRDQDNSNVLEVTSAPGTPPLGTTSGYGYEETFYSLYGTLAWTGAPFGAQVGLRAESARTDFTSAVVEDGGFRKTYRTVYPSFNVSWSPAEGHTLRLLFSKRISRPSAYHLDPFVPSTDPLNRFEGNPDLSPTYMQSWTTDYSWNGRLGTLRIAPFLRHSTDVWERIRTVDGDGVSTMRWENAASARSWGSNFTVSLRSAGRFSGSTNLSLYRDERDGSNLAGNYRRNATLWSLGGNLGIRLRDGLNIQVNANHFPNPSILQGSASGYTFTTMALRQRLFGDRGTVALNWSDPLNLNRFDSEMRDSTFEQITRSSFTSRVLTLTFSVNLGRAPQRQTRPVGGEGATGETIPVQGAGPPGG